MQTTKRKLLVTGCCRSGTLYTSEVLQALHLDVRHERPVAPNGVMGNDGIASWFLAADDPRPPFGPCAHGYEFEMVIHIVREPLAVIASSAQLVFDRESSVTAFVERNAPEVALGSGYLDMHTEERAILRAARYWYHWNRMAQSKADESFRVESFSKDVSKVCFSFGVPFRPRLVQKIPTDLNGRWMYIKGKSLHLTWQRLEQIDLALTRQIRELASSYGFTEA